MAGIGPAPKPAERRARRNAAPNTTRLPAAGRTGKAPRWPLPPNLRLTTALDAAKANRDKLEERVLNEPDGGVLRDLARVEERVALLEGQIAHSKRMEGALWRELWKLPQAVMWERLVYTREVAQYARWAVLGQLGEMDAAKEARQLGDRLGMTPMSMLRLRWEIEAEPEQQSAAPAPVPASRSRYSGIRLVAPVDDAVAS
jgi:hypothetical protein